MLACQLLMEWNYLQLRHLMSRPRNLETTIRKLNRDIYADFVLCASSRALVWSAASQIYQFQLDDETDQEE
jgi:hypothetical protein